MSVDIYFQNRIYVGVVNAMPTKESVLFAQKEYIKQFPSYPVHGTHNFYDWQDVTGLYELKPEPYQHAGDVIGYIAIPSPLPVQQDEQKEEKIEDSMGFPFVKMKDGRWYYSYKDLKGYNQHSQIFTTAEECFNDYTHLCMVREFSEEHQAFSQEDEQGKEAATIQLTKEQVYEKVTMQELGGNPNGTRQEIVWKSMDEYAKQECIAFAEWTQDEKMTYLGDGIWLHKNAPKTREELYKLFKSNH